MLWGAAVVEDIANHYAKKKEEHRKVCEEIDNPFGKGISSSNINLKRQIKKNKQDIIYYQNQIANYKLALSNDTEVMYRLIMQRDVFETASRKFLEKVDNRTKEIFLDTLKEVKQSQENKKDYREKMWAWCNQDNFSTNLLWEVNNQDKIDYTATLYFPDVTKK
ncbi:hypothetical protein A9G24_05390 [Gilliamella sp. App6-5]|uniref:hypothetical protein n=1 Tax=Gilliamella sp. App6-5 TaxID=3120232 RepID=UPI00080E0F47|nr:hypothetical protein [Gilliamella apicola]OCG15403.1 hypothetical protein A9G24_05390 [Gilliamella apicola]